MLQQRRARVAAVAASAAAIFLISLTILDIHDPLEALGFLYRHVYPSVGYSRSASSNFPRAFIPRVALPLCPRTTDLHFPVDIGSDYSSGVGRQRPTVLAPISRQPLVWSAVISPFENQQSYQPTSGAVMFFDGHAVALDSIGLHVALDLEGEHLELVQINFHTPSDFIVEGLQHAAEAHFVHVSSYDQSVVIVVALFDFGSHSPSGFAEALTMVPSLADDPDGRMPLPSFSVLKALGDFVQSGSDKDYYVVGGRYPISGCRTAVRWLVGARPLPMRQEDVYALMSMEGINNQAVDQHYQAPPSPMLPVLPSQIPPSMPAVEGESPAAQPSFPEDLPLFSTPPPAVFRPVRFAAPQPNDNIVQGDQNGDLVVDERHNHAAITAPEDPVVNRNWDDELPNGYVGRTNMHPA